MQSLRLNEERKEVVEATCGQVMIAHTDETSKGQRPVIAKRAAASYHKEVVLMSADGHCTKQVASTR